MMFLEHRAAGADLECKRLAGNLSQERQDRLQLIDAHARELASIRADHALELASSVQQLTREFHESRSWRVTAPLRAVGSLRLKRAGNRHPPGGADTDATAAAPLEENQHPMAEVTLKPPPDPGIQTWPARQFEDLYDSHPDPWGYTTRWYERRKYAITIACLPQERFRRVFEPGCSIGVLSEHLALRADSLICADFAIGAVIHARERLARYSQVEVRHMFVPNDWPDGQFDLIVLSEMATYLSDDDLTTLVRCSVSSLEDDGYLVLVHFRPATGTPHTAEEVHDRFRADASLGQIAKHEEPEFVLDVLQRTVRRTV
jgi:hypothetical protein